MISKISPITCAEILQNKLFKNCFKSTKNILLKTALKSCLCQSYGKNYRLQKYFKVTKTIKVLKKYCRKIAISQL